MKKLIFILLCALVVIGVKAEDSKQEQIEFVSFKETPKNDFDMTKQLIENTTGWKNGAVNSKKKAALLRVRVQNMPKNDLTEIQWNVPSPSYVIPDYDHVEKTEEIWLWVDPAENIFLEAKYMGKSYRQYISVKPKEMYEVVLRNNKTVSIVVNTIPPTGAVVTLENGLTATTPNQINNVSLGKHVLKISYEGRHIVTDTIEVTETSTRFPAGGVGFYDLRQKKSVTFKTKPEGAQLYKVNVDGNNDYLGVAPVTTELPFGSHTIMAVAATDTVPLSINVNIDSEKEYTLEPVPEQTFDAMAFQDSKNVDGDLYIRDKSGVYKSWSEINASDSTKVTSLGKGAYRLKYPIGTKLDLKMSYYGNSKEETGIKVRRGMKSVYDFKIPVSSKTFTWPWEKDFRHTFGGFSFGYVQKQYVTRDGAYLIKQNLWEEGASMHGGQLGMHFEPAFKWGLGLYTGLFWEFYVSSDGSWLDNDTYTYQEHDLYLPIHLYYRLRLGERCHVALHGGIGMDFIVSHNIHTGSETNGTYVEWNESLSEDWTIVPKRFNASGEIGVDFRWRMIGATFTYSWGLTNQGFYSDYGDLKTHTNKMSFAISWMFESDKY
ncbi:MAG: hypothetical protein K2M94_08320 [Paramuribaculum sp.]|nr:hypothetical protein [Paramuribaculum sp.]